MPIYSYICNEFGFLSNNDFDKKLNEYLKHNNINILSDNKVYEIPKKQNHWVETKTGKIINKLKKNDHFIICNITHLARSAFQVYQIFSKLQYKAITLHIIDMNIKLKFSNTMQTKVLLDLCEKTEESFIARRTTDAIKRKEQLFDRNSVQKLKQKDKQNLDNNKKDIMKYLNLKVSKNAISKLFECEKKALSTWLENENLTNNALENITGD